MSPHFPKVVALEDPQGQAILFRALDVVVASLLLALCASGLLLIALAIRVETRGPVLFRQLRCGRGLKQFTILKFRTMYLDAPSTPHRDYIRELSETGSRAPGESTPDGELYKLQNDPRITRVGAFLRRFSLDELPQLWNVLRGEMSVVGPRPAIGYEVDFYRPEWFRRFAVKPGLTGLWQVSGRNELNFPEMLQIDLDYVDRRSLKLNLAILARTTLVVLKGKGSA